jgi:uncharacterized protein
MDITPEADPNLIQVEGYGDGGFTLNGRRFVGTVCLLPTGISSPLVQDVNDLDGTNWPEEILAVAQDLDVLLVGTGPVMSLVPKVAKDALKAAGLHCEPMTTGAGCRTFNVLLLDGRRIGALLFPQ